MSRTKPATTAEKTASTKQSKPLHWTIPAEPLPNKSQRRWVWLTGVVFLIWIVFLIWMASR